MTRLEELHQEVEKLQANLDQAAADNEVLVVIAIKRQMNTLKKEIEEIEAQL